METLTLKSGLHRLNQKQYKKVHALCIDAINNDVTNSVPYFLLAVLAHDHKNFQKADELFSRAEELSSLEPHFPAFLGRLYSELKRPEKAVSAADRASNLVIKDGYLADMLGVIYSRAGYHERAIELFKKAVELDEGKANFFYNLGASELFLGNFPAAKEAFLNALQRDEDHYGAWSSLIALEKQTKTNHNLEHLQKLYSRMSANEDAAHQLGHAIAKSLEDLGRHEDSLEWLHKAKAKKRENYRYNRVSGKATFDAARSTNASQSTGFETKASPIFVVGLPRTGTTLVDRILSSHSDVRSAGELNFFAELIKAQTDTNSNLVLDAETFMAATEIDLSLVGRDYMKRVQNRLGQTHNVVDKMPFNFFYAALISKALPQAKIIALRRGAMDSCLSNYRQLLSVEESFYNYTFDLDDIAFFFREFNGLMSHWREKIPKKQFMEVSYEDIVFDQESQTRRLLDFCGLDFQEACLNFHENKSPVSTASSVQVRQPLYSGSIGRWKKYGNKLDGLRAALGELAD